MKRREFITLIGGSAVAWPVTARAQQPAMPAIGFLHNTSPDASTDRLRGFRQGLKDAGFIEGENVAIEYRWAENQIDRLPGAYGRTDSPAVKIALTEKQVLAFVSRKKFRKLSPIRTFRRRKKTYAG